MLRSKHTANLVARLAASERHHPEQDHTDLRRDLKASRLADFIRRENENGPPLTERQRRDLIALLGGTS